MYFEDVPFHVVHTYVITAVYLATFDTSDIPIAIIVRFLNICSNVIFRTLVYTL